MEDGERNLTKDERRAVAKEEKDSARRKEEQASKGKKTIVFLIIAAIVGWIGYKFVNYLRTPVPEVPTEAIEVTDSDWVTGDQNGKAILIEYGDFQCPACIQYYPIIKRLKQEVTSGLTLVYRNMPLSQHANAMPAAQAAEAAGRQGKYWEMHDMLYEKHTEWESVKNPYQTFVGFAKDLGLDLDTFKNDYESTSVQDDIKADILSANKFGVNATPTFFLNGKKIQPTSYDEFKQLVEAAINS